MSTFAVIGASRGIGLEFVIQLASRPGSTVFAVVRSTTTATHLLKAAEKLKNVHIVEGDVADHASLERAAKQIGELSGGGIDWLIHNAARVGNPEIGYGYDDYNDMNALDADFIESYRINTLGVIHGIAAFLPLIRASSAPLKKIIVISSGAADPNFALQVGLPNLTAYSITKAATNIATTKWAVKLKPENVVVVAVHPGAVDTWETRGESGDRAASDRQRKMVEFFKSKGMDMELLTPTQSVSAQLKTFDELSMEKTGLFLNFDGKELVGVAQHKMKVEDPGSRL